MLSGKDFIILSSEEALLIYRSLAHSKSKATYRELANEGVLSIIKKIEGFLFDSDDKGE